jgi:hypothetical protein
MLALTPNAAAAVNALLDNPELPETSGLRLQRGLDTEGRTAIGIAIVEGPGEGDEAVPAGEGHELYLAPDVADVLEDQLLDAEIQDEGVAFAIRPKESPNGHSPGL